MTWQQDKELKDPLMRELAEFVLTSLEDYRAELEPFEVYAQQLRGHIYQDKEAFCKQFIKGYEVLLEKISK